MSIRSRRIICAGGFPFGRALGLLGLIALLAALAAPRGLAAEAGKTITIGESNSTEQRQQLLEYFKATGDDEVITVTAEDTAEAMAGIFDMSGITTAFSSTALSCRDLGDGLDVTTKNIETVTPGLYAMALVTAGIGDAELVVAAPDGITGVQGMTALTGVFETWEIAPCDSGSTSEARQRLALEELTLTAQIGIGFQAAGMADGVQQATDIVLQSQQTMVTEDLTTKVDIAAAITAQESAQGLTIPADQKAELVDLMTRLAAEDIDWSTFAAGWSIERNDDNTRITMTGDGIAVRNAQASATAQAGAAMTATAQAGANMTATAQAGANMTATAQAALTATAQAAAARQATADAQATAQANALATQQAAAALTATAAAQPTATAVPSPTPTPTPPPVAVSGKIVADGDGNVVVAPDGSAGEPVTYPVDPAAAITRGAKPVELAALAKGDAVRLTVDGVTGSVTVLDAQAAPLGILDRLAEMWWIVPLGVILPAGLWFRRARAVEPFIVIARAV